MMKLPTFSTPATLRRRTLAFAAPSAECPEASLPQSDPGGCAASSSHAPPPRASPSSRKRRQTRVPRCTRMHRVAPRSRPPLWPPSRSRRTFRTFPWTRRGRTCRAVAERQLVQRRYLAGRASPEQQSRRPHPARPHGHDQRYGRGRVHDRDRWQARVRRRPSIRALRVTNLQVMAGKMGMGTPGVLEVGTAASADRGRRDGRDHHRQFAARRQRRRPLAVRHRAHRARQGVDARQREDADVRAPRHRAARGQHDVDAVGGGLGMEGRRPARPAGHPPHQGKRSDGQRLDERRQPVGRAHRAGDLRGWPDPDAQQRACSTTTWARAI